MLRERNVIQASPRPIPVPNSSLYIICWFIINRLPLQFWSRYFLWINLGIYFFFLPPPLQSHCLQTFTCQCQKAKCPRKPWKRSGALDFWSGAGGGRGYFRVTPGNPARRLVIICLSQTRLYWEAPQRSLHKWLAAVLMFIPRFPVYYLCKGAFLFFPSISVNTVDHFISSVYRFPIWMKWSRLSSSHSDYGLT